MVKTILVLDPPQIQRQHSLQMEPGIGASRSLVCLSWKTAISA